jgi:hypothetical protein
MTGPAICSTIAGLGIATSMLLATLPASAETPQQRDWCVAGCTAFIE